MRKIAMENFIYLLITYQSVPSYLKPSTSHLQNKPILTLWLPNDCHTVLPVRRNSLKHIQDEVLVIKSFPCVSCGFSHTGLKGRSVAGHGSGTTPYRLGRVLLGRCQRGGAAVAWWARGRAPPARPPLRGTEGGLWVRHRHGSWVPGLKE